MSTLNGVQLDTTKAKKIWATYQQKNDLSGYLGETAGIEPNSGRIWIGKSILDVVSQRDEAGVHTPLFFVRIGSKTYYRKGGRR